MTFRSYESYRDSGATWIGEVPSHWTAYPLKAMASYNDEVLREDTDPEEEIDYVEISGVDEVRGIVETTLLPFGQAPSRARRRVADGDVLISTVRTYLRAITPVVKPPENLVASTGFAVIRPRHVSSGFLGYALRSEAFIAEVISRSVGVSYPAINASELARIALPLPPRSEQAAIATFLDRETAKIDALVEEQRRLIDLLKEKRKAVISHAVSKGLDPAAPMKDSGVEWLGEIPEHWAVSRFSRLFKVGMGQTILAEDLVEGGNIPVYSATEGDHFFGHINEARLSLEPGDLVIPARGNSIGNVKLVALAATATQTTIYAKARDRDTSIPEYSYWFLIGHRHRLFYFTQTAIPQITTAEVGGNPMLVPPPAEQREIAEHVSMYAARIDGLIGEADSAISLLQERRAALISAAVTGKIDVRDTAAAQAALEPA